MEPLTCILIELKELTSAIRIERKKKGTWDHNKQTNNMLDAIKNITGSSHVEIYSLHHEYIQINE